MIKPLNEHYAFEACATIFDEEAMTALELVGRVAGKVNEVVKATNAKDDTIAELGKAMKDTNTRMDGINTRMDGINKTLGEVVVEPLGFATPQMFGAIGDGEADDTNAIKAAIQALRDHSPVLYFPPGTYLVSEDIELRSNMVVKGSGDTTIIQRAPNNNTHYRVLKCYNITNVVISDLTIMGDKYEHTGTDGEWGSCISLEGVRNVTIERCLLGDGWGDGVYLGASEAYLNTFVNIRDTRINGNRRNGISVITVDGLTIDGCLISNTGGTQPQAGIDFEPNTPGQHTVNVKVSNTTFANNAGVDVLFADTENTLHFMKEALFTGCEFKSKTGLDWRTPLAMVDSAESVNGFVKFSGCRFNNSARCIRITKGNWDTPITLDGCDLSCDSICVELGESNKDYGGQYIGGVYLLNCRVHKNGNNPIIRGVGSNVPRFQDITADLHTNQAIQAYGYFSANTVNVRLDFHEAVYQIGVPMTFDKYKIPSTILISENADDSQFAITISDTIPEYQPIRVINEGHIQGVYLVDVDGEASDPITNKVFDFMYTGQGSLVVIGG